MIEQNHPHSLDKWNKDWVRLIILFVLATIPRLWMLTHTAVPSRDTMVFARYALNLDVPPIDHRDTSRRMSNVQEVIRRAEHPPGFPAFALFCYRLMYQTEERSPERIILATQLASILASLLVILPLYSLAKQLYGPHIAFFLVGIFSVLPVWVEVSANGISDPLSLLFAVAAIQTLLYGMNLSGVSLVYYSLLSGWFIGLGYLVRPDVAILGLSLGLVVLGRLLISLKSRTDSREWFRMLICGLLLTSATLTIVLPYRSLIGRWTNKRTGDALIDTLKGEEVEKDIEKRVIPEVGLAPVGVPLFAAWRTQSETTATEALTWSFRATSLEFLKASFYIFPLFGAIGLIRFFRSQRTEEFNSDFSAESNRLMWMLFTWALLHFLVLILVAFKAGYISERHTLPIVLVCILFSGSGLSSYSKWLAQKFPKQTDHQWFRIVALCLLFVPFFLSFKTLHKQRVGHKEAGLWLKQNGVNEYWLVDPYGWVGFYSGRTLEMPPMVNPRVGPKQYAVWEPNGKEPESKTPLYPWAKSLIQQGRLIYAYPPDAPPEKIQVAIYECEPLKE